MPLTPRTPGVLTIAGSVPLVAAVYGVATYGVSTYGSGVSIVVLTPSVKTVAGKAPGVLTLTPR